VDDPVLVRATDPLSVRRADRQRLRRGQVSARQAGRGGTKDGKWVVLPILPIIPLLGQAAPDVAEPKWPAFTEAEFSPL
jgi:hypothetical protein